MAKEDKDERRETAPPFNMAIASLERVNNLLIEFKNLLAYNISNGKPVDLVERQVTALRLVRQTFLAAAPLLKITVVKELEKKIDALKPKVIPEVNRVGPTGKNIFAYSMELDNTLEKRVLEIVLKLQEEGYFMPPKNDPRYSWSQQ